MTDRLKYATEYGKSLQILADGDNIVAVTGWSVATGATNTVRIVKVSPNMEGLG